MTITGDIEAERAAIADSLLAVGASAPTACGEWTALDLVSHLVAQERLGGLTTFIARSLVARGVAVAGPARLVDNAIRLERRRGFTALVDRLRLPVPRLLLRPRVAPLALFEYWTHHDDLVRDGVAHPAPATLVEVVPLLLDYQLKKLPAGLRVTAELGDSGLRTTVGGHAVPEVTVRGTPEDVVRWLAGRRVLAGIAMTGPDEHVRALRGFSGHV